MHPILLYLLKMLLCSGTLYGYYRVALYNERFHQWNRFYLLAAMLLSVCIPFLEIPVSAETSSPGLVYIIETIPGAIVAKATPVITTAQIVWAGFGLVSILLFIRLFIGLYLIVYKPYRKGEVSSREDIDVVITETPAAPYSFFSLLFWRSDMDPDSPHGKRVLLHELTHIRERHSADKLFVELILVVCWFNPFFWLIRKELYVIHEFLADRKAIEQNNGAAFAEMILQTMNAGHLSPLTNPFFSSHLKRRLKMITTSNKPQFSYLRRITALVAMVTLSFVLMLTIEKGFAQQAPPPPPPPPAAPLPPPPPPKVDLPDSIKSIEIKAVNGVAIATITLKNGKVRKMPVDEAMKKGYPIPPPPPAPAPPAPPAPPTPQNIQPDEIESITIDEQTHHAWVKLKNKTFFELPLLDAQCLIDANPEKVTRGKNMLNLNGEDPLYVYAGLIISKEQMAQVDPGQIESIDVLKGEKAIAAYGEKGKNGVIRITPKSQNFTQNAITGGNQKPIVVQGYPLEGTQFEKPIPVESYPSRKVTYQKVIVGEGYPVNERQDPKEVVVVGYGPKAKTQSTSPITEVRLKGTNGETPPLYVLNGKIIRSEEASNIIPADIESTRVLKDKSATDKYGDKGLNGVIEIELKKNKSSEEEHQKIFTSAEKMPAFPGGGEGWTRHLQKNLRYPDKAIDKGIQGVAKVTFLVDQMGNLSGFEIAQNPGSGLGEEALRVIKEGPNWEPAEQNGKLVNAKVTQNVTFRLE